MDNNNIINKPELRGVVGVKKNYNLATVREMKKLLEEGYKKKTICDKFNISYPTLKSYMNMIDNEISTF
jgi:DNA-binding NarL/FixJ family response regulator